MRRGHRIHVPLSVAPGAEFHICGRDSAGAEQAECSQLLYGEGDVFELNNRRMHYLKVRPSPRSQALAIGQNWDRK